MLCTSKNELRVVSVLLIHLVKEEQVYFVADRPAAVVVLFLTDEAEGLINRTIIVVLSQLKTVPVELTQATGQVFLFVEVEVSTSEVGFRNLVELVKCVSLHRVIGVETNHSISGSISGFVIAETCAVGISVCNWCFVKVDTESQSIKTSSLKETAIAVKLSAGCLLFVVVERGTETFEANDIIAE